MPRRALPVVDPERCTGCGRCVAACPEHVLWLATARADRFGDKHAALHDADGCTGCALCIAPCPFAAIAMQRTTARQPMGASVAGAVTMLHPPD